MHTAISLLALIIPILGLIIVPGLLLYLGWRLVRATERQAEASVEITRLRERVTELERGAG